MAADFVNVLRSLPGEVTREVRCRWVPGMPEQYVPWMGNSYRFGPEAFHVPNKSAAVMKLDGGRWSVTRQNLPPLAAQTRSEHLWWRKALAVTNGSGGPVSTHAKPAQVEQGSIGRFLRLASFHLAPARPLPAGSEGKPSTLPKQRMSLLHVLESNAPAPPVRETRRGHDREHHKRPGVAILE